MREEELMLVTPSQPVTSSPIITMEQEIFEYGSLFASMDKKHLIALREMLQSTLLTRFVTEYHLSLNSPPEKRGNSSPRPESKKKSTRTVKRTNRPLSKNSQWRSVSKEELDEELDSIQDGIRRFYLKQGRQ